MKVVHLCMAIPVGWEQYLPRWALDIPAEHPVARDLKN